MSELNVLFRNRYFALGIGNDSRQQIYLSQREDWRDQNQWTLILLI